MFLSQFFGLAVIQIQVDLLCGPGKLISCSCHLNTINPTSDAINSTTDTTNFDILYEGSSLAGCFFGI